MHSAILDKIKKIGIVPVVVLEDAKDAAKSNMTFIQRLMANLAEIFSPLIPAILAGFVLVYLEKFFRKISPAAISMIIVPFFALVPSVLIAHTVLGPIGWKIGDMISTVVYSGLTSSFSWLFAGVFGFVYAPLVITGLHHMTNAIDLQLMSQVGGTLLWPMIALSNIAQGSAVLAMIYLHGVLYSGVTMINLEQYQDLEMIKNIIMKVVKC